MTSSKGFQHHVNIISKFVCCGCYMKKNVAFTLISFAVLKWDECLSFQLPFELPVRDTGSVASRTRGALASSKCEWTRIWTIQNVDETNQRTDGICNYICIRSHWNTGRFGTLPDLHQSTPFIPLWISKILITCPCPKLIMIEKK